MDLLLVQTLFTFLIFVFRGVTASNITSSIANDTTVRSVQTWTKYGAMHQTYLRFSDSKVGSSAWHEIPVGNSIRFDCDALGNPTPTIRWQKYGRPLQEVSYRYESLATDNSSHLQLGYVLPPDSGNYSCIVTSGNMTKTRLFILKVVEKKETTKPKIKSFLPHNLTVTVGQAAHIQCVADSQFNDTLPFMKLIKYIKVSARTMNLTTMEMKEQLQRELKRIDRKGRVSPYVNRNYDMMKDGDSFTILETVKLTRSLSVDYIIDHVTMADDAIFSCAVFNEVGFSRETISLHVIPPPKPSVYELALAYASKFGNDDSKQQIPLAVTICLPVMVLVILTIGFIWWKENVKAKSKEEKLSLMKIKKLRELDNFSSLEHMEKFSSRMETKRSSFVSEGVGSGVVDDDRFADDVDVDEYVHDPLLGNGHTKLLSADRDQKVDSAKTREIIQLHDMKPTPSETPVMGRSSALGSNSELEWEPVDLKLNIPAKSEVTQILDTSA